MKITSLLFASSLLTGCVIGDQGGSSGQDEGNILYGANDNGDPAVVLVRTVTNFNNNFEPTDGSICTGTLIAPTVVLTAGHCKEDFGFWTDVTFGQAPVLRAAKGDAGYISARLIQNPAYDGDGHDGHDLSIVLLDQAPNITPIARGALPAIGSTVTGVGYGANTFEVTGAGTKRIASFPVTGVSQHEIVAGEEGNGVCHGDSGGPILQNGQLVGATSYGDTANCHGSGHFMRLDDNLDFIHRYAPNF